MSSGVAAGGREGGREGGVVLPDWWQSLSGDKRVVVLPPQVAESKWRQKGSGASATGGRF